MFILRYFKNLYRMIKIRWKAREIFFYHMNWISNSQNYAGVIGNVSKIELWFRRNQAITAISKHITNPDDFEELFGFEYRETADRHSFLVNLFDTMYFCAPSDPDPKTRAQTCYFQTACILILSGKHPVEEDIVISVIHISPTVITYRILYRLDTFDRIWESSPVPADRQPVHMN